MKNVELTLYDIFGYLFPGIVTIVALYLVVWRVMLPNDQNLNGLSSTGWTAFIIAAYVIGHFTQGLSNVISRLLRENPEHAVIANPDLVPRSVIQLATARACRPIPLPDAERVNPQTLYDIMDHCLQQHGRTDNRDLYICREGFYRGLSAALWLLTIGAMFHLNGGRRDLAVFGINVTVTPALALFATVLSAVMAISAVMRYRRFAAYRVKNVVYAFLATSARQGQGDPQ